MAVTIAHGIRNPLTSNELLATILAEEAQADVRTNRLAQGIQAGIASVNSILSNLLSFTMPVKPCFELLDLTAVIEEALSTAHYALQERRIDLMRLYDSTGPLEIDGDRELVKQVFLNLILNAVQAMPSGGVLRISARGPIVYPVPVRHAMDAMDAIDAGVEVKVSDSGCGISEVNREKIFLPFFTTKPKGAGLGLAIVERILEQHGARVNLESRVGEGATFIILFRSRRQDPTSSPGSN
jgi:signal transduction histidine kinase